MASFVPVQTRYDTQGRHLAEPTNPQWIRDFLALAGTDGFVELPPQPDGYPAGAVAPITAGEVGCPR